MHPPPDFTPMPENTPMRIASVEKPLTSAAIRRLITDQIGGLDFGDYIFDLGQPGGGILSYTPWNGLGDARLADITVRHCFDHMGGWNRDIANVCSRGDPMGDEVCIAEAMGIPSPPTRDDIVRYMLGQTLQFTPGTEYAYSNLGYMLLGRVIEQRSGTDPLGYLQSQILTPGMWVPRSEIFYGRSFDSQQSVREPTYFDDRMVTNVFDPDGADVWFPYGGFAIENMIGHGNYVASAAPLLIYMNHYQVGVGGYAGTPLNGGASYTDLHGGTLPGTGTVLRQRSDGINYVLLFNDTDVNGEAAYTMLDAIIYNGGFTWPTRCVDGFWLDFHYAGPQPEFGGYNAPFRTMGAAIYSTGGDGAKLRIKPGSSLWTGTLNYKIQLSAPLGTVRIGG
jgi:CubicO group peptidase (beta-lactamase class C family)